jgi:hypothetical protein
VANEDPDRVHWLHSQACACHPCAASPREIEVNHPTNGRGLGQRGSDVNAFPMCGKHHRQFHAGKLFFDGWTRQERAAWQAEQARKYQALYDAALARGEVKLSNPDDKNLPRDARRGGVIDLLAEARQLCETHGLGRQVELEVVRLVRKAATWGTH